MEEKWIPVQNKVSDVMPEQDCEVYITRWSCFGDRWVQTIPYYVDAGYFEWDGTIAWMPLQDEEPKPYMGNRGY